MNRERFKEILSNLYSFSNDEALPQEHPDQDRAFKMSDRYLNQHFLNCIEAEVEPTVDEHMLKYKDKSIMQQHIKNKPIK